MSDEGGSDLDVFENLSKKSGTQDEDAQKQALLGASAPPELKSKVPPPPPGKGSLPPAPSGVSSVHPPPPPPGPSSVGAPPPPPATISKASLPPPPPPSLTGNSFPPAPSKVPPPPPGKPDAFDVDSSSQARHPFAESGSSSPGAMAPPPPPPAPSSVVPPPPQSSSRPFLLSEELLSRPPAPAPFPPSPSASEVARPTPPPPPPPPNPSFAPPPPLSSPLAGGVKPPGMPSSDAEDWDDDEKTTVFDRSHAESAQALLLQSPSRAATSPRPPMPPASAPLASVPPRPSGTYPPSSMTAPTLPPTSRAHAMSAHAMSAHAMSAHAMSAPAFPAPALAPSFGAPRQGKGKLYAALGGAALLLIVLLTYFVGGSTGGLLVSASGPGGKQIPGVKIIVDDEVRCEESPCKIEGLKPGSYVVRAEAEGFQDLAGKAFEVEDGAPHAINLEMTPDAGTGIKVSSSGPELTLSIDGKEIGPLPQDVTPLEPGEHVVELAGSQYYKPFRKTVALKKGQTLELRPELELEKGKVAIKLDSSAEEAEVTLVVNGKRRSITPHVRKGAPIILPVEGKEYRLVATRSGYENFDEALTFSAQEPIRTITISLSKTSDEEDEDEDEPSASGRTTSRTTSSRRAPSSSPPTAAAEPARTAAPTGSGNLNVNSIPVSNVIVDGRPLGPTPKMNVTVSAGSHTVVFVHPQHGRKVRTVTVKPGQTATAAVRFP